MKKEDLRIVFMGTPDFAVESLKALVENNYNVVGVVTMPDKPSGRGYKLQHSAVKQYSLEKGLPLLQPEKLKDESFLLDLKAWKADLQIVVAFRMLPEVVWDMPKEGTFNLHGSLLPQYRGAAPINWAIINGEKTTGVTTFFLSHKIDTGEIIQQRSIPIEETDNAGIIHDKLMQIGASLVVETVDLIIDGKANKTPQDQLITETLELKEAPKIFKETCRIDWNKSAISIVNRIRGLSPYPTAWTELIGDEGKTTTIKIHSAEINEDLKENEIVGQIVTDNKTYFDVACQDGWIRINKMQVEGKKAMSIDELLRGYKFDGGSRFG